MRPDSRCGRFVSSVKTEKEIAIEITETEIRALEALIENAKKRLEFLKTQ